MPKTPPRFKLINISQNAYDLIADYDAAWCRFTAAPASDLQEVGDAYAELMQRKKELSQYLDALEFNAGINRIKQLRFD